MTDMCQSIFKRAIYTGPPHLRLLSGRYFYDGIGYAVESHLNYGMTGAVVPLSKMRCYFRPDGMNICHFVLKQHVMLTGESA